VETQEPDWRQVGDSVLRIMSCVFFIVSGTDPLVSKSSRKPVTSFSDFLGIAHEDAVSTLVPFCVETSSKPHNPFTALPLPLCGASLLLETVSARARSEFSHELRVDPCPDTHSAWSRRMPMRIEPFSPGFFKNDFFLLFCTSNVKGFRGPCYI
jgi:hypothetical protein